MQIYSVNNNYVSTAKSNGHLTLTAVFPTDTCTKLDIITLYSAMIFKDFLQITFSNTCVNTIVQAYWPSKHILKRRYVSRFRNLKISFIIYF